MFFCFSWSWVPYVSSFSRLCSLTFIKHLCYIWCKTKASQIDVNVTINPLDIRPWWKGSACQSWKLYAIINLLSFDLEERSQHIVITLWVITCKMLFKAPMFKCCNCFYLSWPCALHVFYMLLIFWVNWRVKWIHISLIFLWQEELLSKEYVFLICLI